MIQNGFRTRVLALLALSLALGGCATAPGRTTADDPWEGLNRGIYRFNDVADRATLKPVAKAYGKITPDWMQTGVRNFFANLGYPTTILNQLLQGKLGLAVQDTGRLVINTIAGVGGLIDAASIGGLTANEEDFGQTLAVWGVPSGPYVNLPLFGPSSLRDAPSRIVDYFTGVPRYVDAQWEVEWSARALEVVGFRADLLPVEAQIANVFDRYAFMRDAWAQRREYMIFDGSPPEPTFDDEPLDDAPVAPASAPAP
ncbi:MAG: VacJ family lipoprotein [Steroidobacteraceae bacterium]